MKRPFLVLFCLLFIVSGAVAGEVHKVAAGALKAVADDPVPAIPGKPVPFNPDNSDSPGMIVGTTYYDYQTNGTSGIRIARHPCGTHFVWMNGIGQWSGNRWVYYNFLDPDGNLGWASGAQVSEVQGAGYTQMTVDSSGAALVAFHSSGNMLATLAVDAICGFGLWTLRDVPDTYPGQYDFYWPYVDYDHSHNIQITVCENAPNAGDPQWFGHTWSADGGSHWQDLEIVDSLMCISEIPVASPVDNKVALVYTRPIVVEGQLSQAINDVAYVESEDGVTWNYSNFVNVTNYDTLTDSVFAYTDLAACYDYDGDLHILWNAPAYWVQQGIYTEDSCLLFHWSENTGTNLVYSAWHNSYPGAWNRSASKMSIACDPDNNLFALWTNFDDWDVSQGGWSNGELYFSYSTDGGVTWLDPPMNLTNSETPGCAPGDCESDHWSSLARVVDDSLYILYIEDKDAGGIPQGEGVQTENPVRYLVVPNPVEFVPRIGIRMWPFYPPVRVRPGGNFRYVGVIFNDSRISQTTDIWIMLNVPGIGTYGPVGRYNNVFLAPGDTIIDANIRQRIPWYAPLGTYDYIAYCGDYPDEIIDSASFRFEVYAPEEPGGAAEWIADRWFDGRSDPVGDFVLHDNCPNPFNATTTISFDLPSAGCVNLDVYNLAGQKIATLINGNMDAGEHNVIWDASAFSSGIYFYRLTAGDKVFTRRMTLLK
jgi:hypothetical protein